MIKTVVNSAVAQSVLSQGLNHDVTPAVLPMEDTISGTEKAICSLPDEDAEEI
jgi:hypothetical protein